MVTREMDVQEAGADTFTCGLRKLKEVLVAVLATARDMPISHDRICV